MKIKLGQAKGNPFAICRAQSKKARRKWSKAKLERCIMKVKGKRR